MEHLILYSFLFITVIASGSTLFLFKTENPKVLKLLLAFSGAFLLAISFLNLVPEIFTKGNANIGAFILIGFVLQLLLELLTKGIEHGHGHAHECIEQHNHQEHFPKVAPIGLMIGICIHAFLEGMPIVTSFNEQVQHSLTVGIIIHNIPISIVLMSIFLQRGLTKKRALLYLAFFALMTPAGSMTSNLINSEMTGNLSNYFDMILGVVVGIFLHVSTSILFETSENHQYNIQKFVTVLLGIGIAFLIPMQ
ncbi:MAG: ZIP family metal transporter [Bacteroidales bacterium]